MMEVRPDGARHVERRVAAEEVTETGKHVGTYEGMEMEFPVPPIGFFLDWIGGNRGLPTPSFRIATLAF